MMKKIRVTYFIILTANLFLWVDLPAQTLQELQNINASAKAQFVPPEALDQLMNKLHPFTLSGSKEQDTLLLNTYRLIADLYGANNHYKQGYITYQKFLELKESYYTKEKNNALQSIQNSSGERRKKDDAAILTAQSRYRQLQSDNESLVSKRSGFKKIFSFAIIALSALFAAMLVSSGLKLNSLRIQLQQSRINMKSLQRLSTLGAYARGVQASLKLALKEIDSSGKSVNDLLQKGAQPDNKSKDYLQAVTNSGREIEKNFKD